MQYYLNRASNLSLNTYREIIRTQKIVGKPDDVTLEFEGVYTWILSSFEALPARSFQ